MQNVTAVFTFTLTDDKGEQIHNTTLEYKGLDEARVLFMERHLIDSLSEMNAAASGALANKGKGK